MRLHANPTNVFTGNRFPQLKTISNVSFEVLWEFVGLPLINLRYARFSAWKQALGTDSWVELSVMESTTRLRSATNVPSLEVYFAQGLNKTESSTKSLFTRREILVLFPDQGPLLGLLMDHHNETPCVKLSCSWGFLEPTSWGSAICSEPKRSVFEMPIAPLQIDHSVVVKSQAIAVNAPLMNLGSHFVILVTSVTLARLFYGSFQHVGHLRILNRFSQKFLPTVPKAKAQYTSFSWNLDLPKRGDRPGCSRSA